MPQVEVHHVAVRCLDRAPLLLFLHEGLRQAVAWSQLHRAQHRLGLWSPEVVILQITVAILVQHVAAFVVKGKTRPQPPVHRITAFARIAWICPDISSMATTPCTRPSSTSILVTNHSS